VCSYIVRLSSQFRSGKRKSGISIRRTFIPNFPIDVWRLTVLATVAIVVTIVVVVVIFVFVVVATWSFRHIVSISANRNHGSYRKVLDKEIIDLPHFALIYDLVNYKFQFQDVRECAFINESKGGVEGGVVDLPLQPKFSNKTSDENPLFFNVPAALLA
jgi:hypothetical protein